MPKNGKVTRPRIEPMLMINPSPCLRMAGSTERMVRSNPTTFVLNTHLGLIGREGLSDPGGCNAGVVDEHINPTNMCEHRLHGLVDRSVTADIELEDLDALLAQCLRMVAVLRFRIAHRSEYGEAGAGQGFGGITAETCAGASDQDCLGHDGVPFLEDEWRVRRCGLVSAACGRESRE